MYVHMYVFICVSMYLCMYTCVCTHPYAGRDWGQEEKGTTEDEMAGWQVAENGMNFTIHLQENGEYRDINEVLTGFRTYTSAEAAAAAEGKVDVIIYMTKATQLEAAIADSLPLAGENTVACSLINGLGNDDNLLKFFPAERCIIGSGVLGTAMPAPGSCVSTPAGGVQ